MRGWIAGSSALALLAVPVHAQDAGAPPTTITPDTLPQLSTGTTATTEGTVTTIGGGVRAGDNLFHSFSRFTLGPGDIARWTASDALTIRNVINRVTGGERSFIAGSVDGSAFAGADFYFINPAGIVFGDGAAIDVGGTAHFSTAHQLGFADGTMLVSGTASGSSFSMAEPVRFGFLGNNAPITINRPGGADGSELSGVRGGRITLSAGDIALFDTFVIGERLTFAALGDQRTDLPLSREMASSPLSGSIRIINTTIIADGEGGGSLEMAAGEIRLEEGGTVEVLAQRSFGPALRMVANRLEIVNGDVRVASLPGAEEPGGDLQIDADEIIVRQRGSIGIVSTIEGGGGAIRLNARHLLVDGGDISARGLSGPGRSVGDIHVRADLLEIFDFGALQTSICCSDGQPVGTTGNIFIDAGRIVVGMNGFILAQNQDADASGPGSITIRANEMSVGLALISTATFTAVPAGTIDISVRGLFELSGFGGIQSLSQGLGNAGDILIRAGTLRLVDDIGGPKISSETEIPRPQEFTQLSDYTGSAGRIFIETDNLEMMGRTSITTSSASLGDAGNIVINAGRMTLTGDASIESQAQILNVPPTDEEIEFNIINDIPPSFRIVPGPGRAGTITLVVADALTMNGGTISTATEGFGAAGGITVVADRIRMGAGSRISSDAGSEAPGQAGTVVLIARQIALSEGAQITTSSANVTTAGGIALAGEEDILITGADTRIASINSAVSGGAAGNIIVGAPRITLGPAAAITTSSLTGAAGEINLLLPRTGLLRLAGGVTPAEVSTSSGPGTGGRIFINQPYAVIADGARIEALGQQGGALAVVEADFFIRSADNSNLLLVDGDLVVDSQVGNVSSGIDTPDISFGDAAGVLAGQCRAARSSGSVSRLAIDQVGPLALDALDVAPSGGCR